MSIYYILPHFSNHYTYHNVVAYLRNLVITSYSIHYTKLYDLRIKMNAPKTILVGKREIKFKKGDYFYIGSAMGDSMNLYNRINRHLSDNKNKRWHIDYLLEFSNVKEVNVTLGRFECDVSKRFNLVLDSVEVFGCSDCKCKSHLYYIKP